MLDHFKFQEARNHRNKPREVIWICGAPGTGKSALALAYARKIAGENYYVHPAGPLKWWDGYVDQPVVIINDFRRSQLKEVGGFSYLLNITDRYDVMVEGKGCVTRGAWDVCIITSPSTPDVEFTYHGDDGERVEEHLGQLIRRLKHIIELHVLDGKTYEISRTDELKHRYGVG